MRKILLVISMILMISLSYSKVNSKIVKNENKLIQRIEKLENQLAVKDEQLKVLEKTVKEKEKWEKEYGNSASIMASVDSAYNNAWTRLTWVLGILGTIFVGVQWYRNSKLDKLKETILKLEKDFKSRIDNIDDDINIKLKNVYNLVDAKGESLSNCLEKYKNDIKESNSERFGNYEKLIESYRKMTIEQVTDQAMKDSKEIVKVSMIELGKKMEEENERLDNKIIDAMDKINQVESKVEIAVEQAKEDAKQAKISSLYAEAIKMGINKKYRESINQYTTIINEYNVNVPEIYYNRAIMYTSLEEYNEALDDYNVALNINPRYSEAYNGRGHIYSIREEYDAAMKEFNLAIKFNNMSASSYNNRGYIYFKKGDYDKALMDLNMSIDLDKFGTEVYHSRAELYYEMKRYPDALKDINKHLEINVESKEGKKLKVKILEAIEKEKVEEAKDNND